MTADDPRLAKIRALLAQAESTTFPEEAQTFTAKAQELMVKWAVDDAMLAASRPGHATSPESITIRVGNPPYQGPKQLLLSVIARTNDCRIVLESINRRGRWDPATHKRSKGERYTQAYVIGFPHDLEFVQVLFTSCLLQAETEFESAEVQGAMFRETSHPGHRIRWRNAFMMAYALRIGQRLYEVRQATIKAAEASSPGVGLVLVGKADKVALRVGEMFGKLQRGQGSQAGAGGGSGAGYGHRAADRASLGQPGVGEGPRGLDA